MILNPFLFCQNLKFRLSTGLDYTYIIIEDTCINLPRYRPVDMAYTDTSGTTEVRDVCGTKSAG